jgi:Tol biopolymer transport system component
MSTSRTNLTDELLKRALSSRAGGAKGAADLLDDVLPIVQSTTQGRRWELPLPPVGRPLVLLAAAALLLSAIVGFALGAGGRFRVATPVMPLATPVTQLGDGDIAFIQARYSWDGSKDWNGAPTPTVEDQHIATLASDGGEPTLLSRVPASTRQTLVGSSAVGPSALRWSPDGTRIAFRLLLDAPGIYVMNRDGRELTRLTDLPEPFWHRDMGQPTRDGFAWSPDGTRIAFTSPAGTDGPGGGKSSSLYVVDTSDGRLTELTGPNATGGAFPPIAWSPDGSRIAFARSIGPLRGSTNSLVVTNADGTDEALLVQVEFADLGPLAWSPDGSRIAFLRSSTMGGNKDGAGGLWLMNPDGTDLQQIATGPWAGPTEVRAVFDWPFAWSPDGHWIAMIGGPDQFGITLVTADGSQQRIIDVPGSGNDNGIHDFAWSPDGSQLVFSDNGRAVAESPPTWDPGSIYVVNADGTGRRWLADGEYPDWSR